MRLPLSRPQNLLHQTLLQTLRDERAARQGIGRQPREEVAAAAIEIVDAFATHLGDRPYFCGDKPSTFDATAYAFASGLLCEAFDHEVHRHTKSKANLVAYQARLKEQYWKE